MTTSAREQSSRLADLLRREHSAMADFLVELAGFDRVRAWAELGYASLFDYLHRHLGLSKGSAFYRMTAARLVRDHPELVDPLRDGRPVPRPRDPRRARRRLDRANLRCLCAAHNDRAAREVFGGAHMDRFTRRVPRDVAAGATG